MANIERLAPELLIAIPSSCRSFKNMHSLTSASPACFRTFLVHREYIVPSVWRNMLDPANYRELLAIFHVPSIVAAEAKALTPFLKHYFSTRPFEHLHDPTSMARMCRLYNTLSRLTNLYFLHAAPFLVSSRSSETPGTTTAAVTPISTTETIRLQRALLRYELYSRVFPCGEKKEKSHPRHGKSLIGAKSQFNLFIRRLKPWEVEDLSSIHYYLTSLACGYMMDIEDQFVDAFRSCAQLTQEDDDNSNSEAFLSPLFILPPFASSASRSDQPNNEMYSIVPNPKRKHEDNYSRDHYYSIPFPNPKRRRLLGTPPAISSNKEQATTAKGRPDVPVGEKVAETREQMVRCDALKLVGLDLFDARCGGSMLPEFTRHLTSFGLELFLKLIDASGNPKQRRELIRRTPGAPCGRKFLLEALGYLTPKGPIQAMPDPESDMRGADEEREQGIENMEEDPA
ncbi:hypothetical protein V8F06_006152 [Rhypophila decipiens]